MKQEMVEKLLNLVQSNYQIIAADFATTRKKEIWPEVKVLAEKIENGSRVLDVGCGSGRLLEALSDKDIDYLGVDTSAELLQLASARYPQKKFATGNILDLSAVGGHDFVYVFCLAVLPHIPGQSLRIKALKELKSKLGPEGRIILSAWNLWPAANGRERFYWLILKGWLAGLLGFGHPGRMDFGDLVFPWKDSQGKEISLRYYHAFSGQELRNLVRQAGLKIESFKRDKFNYWLILK